VLLVTHDVEEALLLCDRVLVLADGRISASFEVDVPRVRTDLAFVGLRERALEAIA
jgi:sulfonate transport system ATP-binding protein